MKIVTIKGGLGNQIFQYLFYLQLKSKNKKVKIYLDSKELKNHNGWELNKWFNIEKTNQSCWLYYYVFLLRLMNKLKIIPKINERNYTKKGLLYDGYWQDKKFYMDSLDKLKIKKLIIPNKNQTIIKDMEMETKETISIHIRRGDYMNTNNFPIYGNICTKEYYQKAISIIVSKIQNPIFYIFSNDINWVKDNLNFPNAIFIDWNNGEDSFYDMLLMTHCKHHIIANSTFSYWGAILSKHKNCINIYPSKWYNSTFPIPDIFPSNWIGL